MKRVMHRRQFLRGAGGAFLALPFLPSVATRAFAACEPNRDWVPKCFFAIGTGHGGVWGDNMYPAEAVLTDSAQYAGRAVRYGDLSRNPDAGGWSPVCTAARLAQDPGLAGKFNILRGLDIPYRISHHSGGYLGSFADTVGQTINGVDARKFRCPTIDQFMAWEQNERFYTQEDIECRMTQRSFSLVSGEMSWNHTSPSTKTGDLVSQQQQRHNGDLFRFFFQPGTAYSGVNTFIVDRIKNSYSRLKRHPRLSKGDERRLDQHLQRMFEVERKLRVVDELVREPSGMGCPDRGCGSLPPDDMDPRLDHRAAPQTCIDEACHIDSNYYSAHHSFPHNPDENKFYWGLLNDVVVLAFASGVSRIGTAMQNIKFATEQISDWHGAVAHEGRGENESQLWTHGWTQGTFEHVMVDLAAKMDATPMTNGSTLLDNSLLMYVQEAGQVTHHTGVVNYPVITAGSAGGFFNTGKFVDFGNQDVTYDDLQVRRAGNPQIQLEHPGLYYNQFLANVVQSMGIPRAEYETFTDFGGGERVDGYGLHFVDPDKAADYARARTVMGDPLPVITNG